MGLDDAWYVYNKHNIQYDATNESMYARVGLGDVPSCSKGSNDAQEHSCDAVRNGGRAPTAGSRTELDSDHCHNDFILHDFDSLHDSRQRKSWRRCRTPPCRDNLRIVWNRTVVCSKVVSRETGKKQEDSASERRPACFQYGRLRTEDSLSLPLRRVRGGEVRRGCACKARLYIESFVIILNGKVVRTAIRRDSRPHGRSTSADSLAYHPRFSILVLHP